MSSPQTRHLPPVLLEKRPVYLHFLNARACSVLSRLFVYLFYFILFYIFMEKSLK